MNHIEFSVNGRKCRVNSNLHRDTTLNAYLRYVLALPGTKAMCHQGGCGVCIVSVEAKRPNGKLERFSVNSCLVLVFSCHGWAVTTVEGLGDRSSGYSEEQKRISDYNASQCGYCTPGWVMQLHSLIDKKLTMKELEHSFGSNTCRCTGYRTLLDAIKSFGIDAKFSEQITDIEDIPVCPKRNSCVKILCSEDVEDWTFIDKCDLEASPKIIELDFILDQKFFKVYEEDQIFKVLDKAGYDSCMICDGNTGKGLLNKYTYPQILIDVSDVKSLKTYKIDQNLILGANISIQDTLELFYEKSVKYPEFSYLKQMAEHLEKVAHLPIRKIGSLAGNLMMKKKLPYFQSDIYILFECVGAVIVTRDASGKKTSMNLDKFLEFNMEGKVMVQILLPPLGESYAFRSYKIMPRHQNALAIVNAAFLIKINRRRKIIEEASIVFGNISTKFVHAKKTEKCLKGKNVFTNKMLRDIMVQLDNELFAEDIPPEPSPVSRKKIALGLFYRFFLSICQTENINARYRSGLKALERPLSCGQQDFETHPSLYPVSEPVKKLESMIQCSGEARYSNDLPPLPRQVFGAFVLATIHSGEISCIDISGTLEKDGAIGVLTAKDIPGKNTFVIPGINLQYLVEEEILVSNKIDFYGQPVAIVVAETERLATKLAHELKVTYKNVSKSDPVLTIVQAMKDKSRIVFNSTTITPKGRGDGVTKILKGAYEIDTQYHYYTEPMTCVVFPEDQKLIVHDSTQNKDLTQIAIAASLDMKESDITITVPRIGGAFGGKITSNARISTACALVARKLNRPCRFILPLQTNMMISGKRLPCRTNYEIGVDDEGKIQYLDATIYENKGYTINDDVTSRTVMGFPNCYNSDYWNVKAAAVITDLPSNNYMRAPGSCEATTTIEHIIERIAFETGKDPTEVRLNNLDSKHDELREMIESVKIDTDFEKRNEAIKTFNQQNRWKKKAIQLSVMAYPITYERLFHSLVTVYKDGTVSVTTGGIEMGQGLNTKVAQACAYTLNIPLKYVSVLPSYSFTSANDNVSASGITSEACCFATIKACEIILERLKQLRQDMDNPSWEELISKAIVEEIDISAMYLPSTKKNEELQKYYCYSVCVIEVELDVLVGNFEIARVDILEDAGISTSPNIDVGQVEGAYIQALGYFTSEKCVYDKKTGRLLTDNPLKYHVPLALDIPADFRVKLKYNTKNKVGVLGSKSVGETCICIGPGVMHALRRCIYESRMESGYNPRVWIDIETPFSPSSVVEALGLKIEDYKLE